MSSDGRSKYGAINMKEKQCHCGSVDCWPDGDLTWVADEAGWRGQRPDGCSVSIYFCHGKVVAEERHLPEISCSLVDFITHLKGWAEGLVNPEVYWSHDTGDGEAALWLRDVRAPSPEDWQRLENHRTNLVARECEQLAKLKKKYGE